MLKYGAIVAGCAYLMGGLAFTVVSGSTRWMAGWSLEKALASGLESALFWPEAVFRALM